MESNKRNLARMAVYATVIGSMALSLVPAGRAAAAQGSSRKIGPAGARIKSQRPQAAYAPCTPRP